MTWAQQFGSATKRVALTYIGCIYVSTVFLGLDHGYPGGPPLLFETMIFDGIGNDYQTRCSTWEQAEAMHDEAVKLVKRFHHKGLKKPSALWRIHMGYKNER